MPTMICEECLTRHGRIVLCVGPGDTCRVCGHAQREQSVTRRDIERCLRARDTDAAAESAAWAADEAAADAATDAAAESAAGYAAAGSAAWAAARAAAGSARAAAWRETCRDLVELAEEEADR